MEKHYYINLILHFLQSHPRLCSFFIFIIAFSESLPVIGTIVPGSITMTVVGILIGNGTLPGLSSLIIASIGAFAGDATGFAAGYYYNDRLRDMWPFRKYPNWLTMGEAFFKKHGGKSIILGRFIGPARSTVPLIAGLLKLSWSRFTIAAIPSAVFWALMYMTPGIVLGTLSREIPKAETTRFFLYGIGTILFLWLIYWLIQHFFIQLTRVINYATDKLWNYLSRKNTGLFFIRFVTNQQDPSDHHQLTLLFVAILSGILFLLLFANVLHQDVLIGLNYPLFHLLQTVRTSFGNQFFSVITIIGVPKTILLVTLLFSAGLMLKKQWRAAMHFLAAFVLTAGAVYFFKLVSHSLRPQGFEVVSTTSSFPSGHTTLSLVIYSFIAFFIAQIAAKDFRWIGYTMSSILIAMIGFSRLYLGAHWFTDIIGSVLLGLTILLLCIISYRRMPTIKGVLTLSPFAAIAMVTISLCVPWSINIDRIFTSTMNNTTPIWPKQKIWIASWWESPHRFTPLYRNNRLGKPFQPFNVQWQGSLEHITTLLQKQGWQQPITKNVSSKLKATIQRFASSDAQYHIPFLPWLYQNKPPVLFLVKLISNRNRVIELRLWQSEIHLQPGNKPLWIGETDILIPPKVPMSLREQSKITLEKTGGLDQLHADTAPFLQKIIYVDINSLPKQIKKLKWDGSVLLIRE